VLIAPVAKLKQLIDEDAALGDLILRTLLGRGEALEGMRSGVRITGSRYSLGTHRLREFAVRNRVAYAWDEVELDAASDESLRCAVPRGAPGRP